MKSKWAWLVTTITVLGAFIGCIGDSLGLWERIFPSSPSQKEIVIGLADKLINAKQVIVRDSLKNNGEVILLQKFQNTSKLYAKEYNDFQNNHKSLSNSPMVLLYDYVKRDAKDLSRATQLLSDNIENLKSITEILLQSNSKWNNKIDITSLKEIKETIQKKNVAYNNHFNKILSSFKGGDVLGGIKEYDEMIEDKEILKCDEIILRWNNQLFELTNNRLAEIMNE